MTENSPFLQRKKTLPSHTDTQTCQSPRFPFFKHQHVIPNTQTYQHARSNKTNITEKLLTQSFHTYKQTIQIWNLSLTHPHDNKLANLLLNKIAAIRDKVYSRQSFKEYPMCKLKQV